MTNTQGAGERWWDYDSANQEIVNYAKAPDVEQFACIDPDDMRDVVEELNRLTAQAGLAQRLNKAASNFLYDACYECGERLPCSKPFHAALRDALTAGPEAVELGWASLGTSDEQDDRIRQFMEGTAGPEAAAGGNDGE